MCQDSLRGARVLLFGALDNHLEIEVDDLVVEPAARRDALEVLRTDGDLEFLNVDL